jgi:hypothetical protein
MTTEVAILNRSAVALAADSAATISTGGGLKVYDGVNKLFELIKGRPVGVMIYNAADVALRPWETVIKTYRADRRTKQFDTLEGYTDDLLDYVSSHRQLFSDRQQLEALTAVLTRDAMSIRAGILGDLNRKVQNSSGGGLTERQARTVARQHIRSYWEYVHNQYDMKGWSSSLPSERTLQSTFRSTLDGVIAEVFQQFPLDDNLRANLRTSLLKRVVGFAEEDSDFSGLVIAGFGQDEYYPRLREFKVKGMLDGNLLFNEVVDSRAEITATLPAAFRSFAQGDMVRSFTDGIQDQVRGEMIDYWSEWRGALRKMATGRINATLPSLGASDRDEVRKLIEDVGDESVNQFFDHMSRYEAAAVRGPLLQSVAFLPKDEMGAMAESLVNLTTLKRKVSINEAQTVGGAVDVAVISRGDGFVWLKRKHYFDQAINPTWPSTHSASAPE